MKQRKYFKVTEDTVSNFDRNLYDIYGNVIKPQHKYSIPNSIHQDKIQKQKLATDSKALDADLPINAPDLFGSYYDLNAIISIFAGYGGLSVASQSGIVQNIIKALVEPTCERWGKLRYTADKNDSVNKKLELLEARAQELELKMHIKQAHEYNVLLGGCMLYTKIQGDDDILDTEFVMDQKIKIRYLKVVEPVYCVPTTFEASNPLNKHFYIPEIWSANGIPIHISRLTHFIAQRLPTLIKPIYNFYGESLINLVLKYIVDWENIRSEIVKIISRYNINLYKTDLSSIIGVGDPTQQAVSSVKNRLALYNKIATNFGAMVLDKEAEEFENMSMSLGNLDALAQQNLEYIASITRIPSTILLGQSPHGFGSSGNLETLAYENRIKDEQTTILMQVNHIYKLLQLELFGQIDPKIVFEFNPVREPNLQERATAFNQYLTTLVQATGSPIVTIEEAREFLASQEDLNLSNIDVDATLSLNNENDDDEENSDYKAESDKG